MMENSLSKTRLGEIAIATTKEKVKNGRIPRPRDLKRIFGIISKNLGIDPKEVRDLSVIIYSEVFSEVIAEMKGLPFEKTPPSQRLGEIIFAFVKEEAKEDRIPDKKNLKRTIGAIPKDLGISQEEYLAFWTIVYSEIFSETIAEIKEISFEKKSLLKKIWGSIKDFFKK
jgi:hypothetical protein